MTEGRMEEQPLRPLGHMERFNIIRNHVKFYNNVQATARYRVPRTLLQSDGNSGVVGLVYAALKETLNHQPILGIAIDDESSKNSKWVRLQTIDFREIVEFINMDPNTNLDECVRDAHRTSFMRPDLPLWRIVVCHQDPASINESHVIAVGFFGHHAIVDGLSCAAFHLTFRDALNSLLSTDYNCSSSLEEAAIVAVPKLPLVPNLEMNTNLSVSIPFVLRQVFKAFIYNPIDKSNWSGPLIDANTPRPPINNLRSFSLPTSTVNQLVAKCREQKTTITALVNIIVARKLAVMYPGYKRFTGHIPFSVRKFTGHTLRDMGCYISSIEPYFSSEASPPTGYISCALPSGKESDDQALWKNARTCKKFIESNTSSMHDQMVNMLKFVNDYKSYFLGQIGQKRGHAFEISNIGVVDGGLGDGEGKASFDKITFSAGHCTSADPYVFYLATAKNGFMTISLSWELGTVEDEDAEELLGWLERALKEIGVGSRE